MNTFKHPTPKEQAYLNRFHKNGGLRHIVNTVNTSKTLCGKASGLINNNKLTPCSVCSRREKELSHL